MDNVIQLCWCSLSEIQILEIPINVRNKISTKMLVKLAVCLAFCSTVSACSGCCCESRSDNEVLAGEKQNLSFLLPAFVSSSASSRATTSFISAPAEPTHRLQLRHAAQHAAQHALRVFQIVASLMLPAVTSASFNQVFVPLHGSVPSAAP